MKNLSELKLGTKAIIDSFSDKELALKLMEMGCLPGEKIHIERKAPLGDPIAISISGYVLSMRKAEAKIIKDWMSKAKSGAIDYFDIVRGLQTGDASRAYPFELRFLKGILDRDKIMNRFRSYYKGKKGKKR